MEQSVYFLAGLTMSDYGHEAGLPAVGVGT